MKDKRLHKYYNGCKKKKAFDKMQHSFLALFSRICFFIMKYFVTLEGLIPRVYLELSSTRTQTFLCEKILGY